MTVSSTTKSRWKFLQGLTYSSTPIDMSNGSANLASGFTFAIQTGLKRFVKVRVSAVVTQVNDRHLVLEMEVYQVSDLRLTIDD